MSDQILGVYSYEDCNYYTGAAVFPEQHTYFCEEVVDRFMVGSVDDTCFAHLTYNLTQM